jgi:hypothetical protein
VTRHTAKRASRRIQLARIARVKGQRVLMVRVVSTRRSERIKVRIGNRTYRRTVRSNHLVQVASLALPDAGKVTVTLG